MKTGGHMLSVGRLGPEAAHEALHGQADMAKLHQLAPQFSDVLTGATVIALAKQQEDASGI